jgi:hypothetical protein
MRSLLMWHGAPKSERLGTPCGGYCTGLHGLGDGGALCGTKAHECPGKVFAVDRRSQICGVERLAGRSVSLQARFSP